MAGTDIRQTTTTTSTIKDYSVSPRVVEESQNQDENYYYCKNFTKYYGYYRTIPELKKAIDALVMWAVGLGYRASNENKIILEHITGNGKETFDTILSNFLATAVFNGDAFIEIVKDAETDTLINLKNLNPANMRVCYNKKGIITHYEYMSPDAKDNYQRFKPEEILHYQHDKIVNEFGGTSVIEACQWVIDARNEAMSDKRRAMHRKLIRVVEVDADDSTKLTTLKNQWADAIKNGEVLIVPKDNVGFPQVPELTTAEHSEWIRYLEGFFYKAAGVPEIILGGSQQYSEASSKIGHLTFEQPHKTMRNKVEKMLWNQLYMKIDFDEPTSIKPDIQESEAANTGQVGFQPNEAMATLGRTE